MARKTTTLSTKVARYRGELAVRRGPLQRKSAPFVWPDYRVGRPEWHLVNLQAYVDEGFNLNTLVYSAIMYKVRALQQVILRAYKGDIDHPEALEADHPLSKLVARPNPHQSFIEFQSQSIVYLNLAGNCYVFLDRPKRGGLPEAMYSMRPDRVFIIPGKGRRGSGLQGFLYVPEGKSAWRRWSKRRRQRAVDSGEALPILSEDMMHVKLPNPGDPLEGMGYGLSPLSPAARSVDVDNMITHFLKLFFEHGASFQGVLSFDVPLDSLVIPEIRERWSERYGGYENWAEVGILDQGGKYTRITPNFEEMGFESIDDRNETRVIAPFGVPPILLGTRIGMNRSTLTNYEESRKMCWEDILVPESKLFEVDYQYYLQGEQGEFVAYDYGAVPALRKDLTELVTAWVALVMSGVPKNEATATTGLPLAELPDGDVVYMPLNMMAVGVGASAAARTEEGAAEAEEDERKMLDILKKNVNVGG